MLSTHASVSDFSKTGKHVKIIVIYCKIGISIITPRVTWRHRRQKMLSLYIDRSIVQPLGNHTKDESLEGVNYHRSPGPANVCIVSCKCLYLCAVPYQTGLRAGRAQFVTIFPTCRSSDPSGHRRKTLCD